MSRWVKENRVDTVDSLLEDNDDSEEGDDINIREATHPSLHR